MSFEAIMSLEEEAQSVLDDVFVGVEVAVMNNILNEFFNTHNVENDWDNNNYEMNSLLIDEQDSLEIIRDEHLDRLFTV